MGFLENLGKLLKSKPCGVGSPPLPFDLWLVPIQRQIAKVELSFKPRIMSNSASAHSADFSNASVLNYPPPLKPIHDVAGPAGYGAPAIVQRTCTQGEIEAIAQTAETVLRDPILLRMLADRVYQLMRDDLRMQQERNGR